MMSEAESGGDLDDKFRKSYSLRRSGRNGASIITGLPKEPIEREMRKRGCESMDTFLRDYVAAVYYDETDGLEIRFEPVGE